ncbi:hypothetical protein Hanom_Chr06g00549141 [Helianthus anomalus]
MRLNAYCTLQSSLLHLSHKLQLGVQSFLLVRTTRLLKSLTIVAVEGDVNHCCSTCGYVGHHQALSSY